MAKKFLSLLLTFVMVFSFSAGSVTAYAEDAVENENLPGTESETVNDGDIPAISTFALDAEDGDQKEITVFFTSDLHGAFTGTNYATQGSHRGFSRIATELKTRRAALDNDGKKYLTLDVGDTIQGAGTSGFINNDDYTFPMVKAFNYMDFDAVIPGNHEFNFGVEAFLKAYNGTEGTNNGGFNGAKLCGNVFQFTGEEPPAGDSEIDGTDALLEGFAPYKIFDLDGVKVAVIGMTNPGSDTWDKIKLEEAKLYTESAIGATKRAIDAIKADPDGPADVIVLAAHMSTGDVFGRLGSGAASVLADSYIAQNVDVFLGAHGHTRQVRTFNGVQYGENASNGSSLGVVTLKVTYGDDKWSVKNKTNDVNINMYTIAATVAEDADYLEHMQPEIDFALNYASLKIGELINGDMVPASPVKGTNMNPAYFQPTKLVSFINDVQKYYANAEISGACPFSTSVQHLEGDITRGSLIGIYNYDSNTVYRLQMKGWQVKRWMEYVAQSQYTDPTVSTDLSVRFATSYRTDSFSGLNYTVDLTKPRVTSVPFGDRVTISTVTRLDGTVEPFDLNETYIVAANDYRTSSSILTTNFFTQAELDAEDAPKLLETDCNRGKAIAPDIISLMVDYISDVNGGVIDASDYEKNWEITPWWDAALRARGEKLTQMGLITNVSPSNALTVAAVNAIPSLSKTLTVFSFNDFHGTLDKTASSSNPGADRFVGFVKDQMADAGGGTMVLAAGDNYQGSPMSNLTTGEPVSEMLKLLGVKYSAIGNHEFDWGTANFAKWKEDGKITFLCANIFNKGTDAQPDFCRPYAIEEIDGIKVGIIGLITPETKTLVKAEYVDGFYFRDPGTVAAALEKELRAKGCDIVIALAHSGALQDPLNTGAVTGDAAAIANAAPGLDAIIAGHSHRQVSGKVNGVPIVQGYYNGRGLGKLVFNLTDGGLTSVTQSYVPVPASYANQDAEMKRIVDEYAALLEPLLKTVVGQTVEALPDKPAIADWAGQLIYDYILREDENSYVVIQNDGGWRSVDGLAAGADVTMGWLYTLMPFDNEIVLMDLAGAPLLEILNQTTEFTSKPDINGAYKQGGDWYLADGTKIDATGTYKVMCNDFMFTGGDKYTQFAQGQNARYMGVPLRDAMIEELRHRELLKAIALAESKIKDSYTEESWQALQSVLTAAKEIAGNKKSTLDEKIEITGELKAAIAALADRIAVVSVKINSAATSTVRKNKTLQLAPVFTPANANYGTEVTWTSSNAASVKVDAETGLVTGIKAGGSARVTATTSNGKTYTITVTVDS